MTVGRRRFLSTALGAAGLACGRCATAPAPPGPRTHVVPASPRPPAQSTVAVVRAAAFPSLRAAVAEAIRLAGGLSFVRPGQSVLLKPAVNSGRPYPATTDPEVVRAVAEQVLEAGGRPVVADRTMFLRSTSDAFRRTGILEAAHAVRIPCLPLDDAPVVALQHRLAGHWSDRTVRVYRAVAEADHVVSLCTPRTHSRAGYTMAAKNLVGVVDGAARLAMHLGGGFRQRVAEISLVVQPSLVVMDGRLGLCDGGPDEGALCRPGFVAAGRDPLALDAVGLAYLRLAGTNASIGRGPVWQLPIMQRAVELGLGVSSADAILLAGIEPDEAARLRRAMG